MSDIKRRVRACDYLTVAQLFLQDNFLLANPLTLDNVKPRLLGHWGTCHGINVVYANLKEFDKKYEFVLGPGHGFPALQANLFVDGELLKVDEKATRDEVGIAYICRNFSWPGGFPSHASPVTPGVICEGGELGYALATAYGAALGHPEKKIAVLIGDGELETATAMTSLSLNKLVGGKGNGKVLPILHLNGYKISGPTIAARKEPKELVKMFEGCGFEVVYVDDEDKLLSALEKTTEMKTPLIIFASEKGKGGPKAGNYTAHQIPLKKAGSDPEELKELEKWLKSYHFEELYADLMEGKL